jgi:hypothetical protein
VDRPVARARGGGFLWSLGRALGGQRTLPRCTISLAGLWLACSACLLAIYVSQEALEGLFATGHPTGLAGIFGYGGSWALPVSACVVDGEQGGRDCSFGCASLIFVMRHEPFHNARQVRAYAP